MRSSLVLVGGAEAQLGLQMTVEWLTHGRHAQFVGHDLAVDSDVPLDGVDLLGRRRPRQRNARHRDRRALEPSLGNFGMAVGMGDDQLDGPGARHTPETRLAVQRPAVVEGPRPLGEGEDRLAYMPDADLLAVLERGDRRVEALALAHPRAEQKPERRDVRMERGPVHTPDPNPRLVFDQRP